MPDSTLSTLNGAALTQDPAADARTAITNAVNAKLQEAAAAVGVALPVAAEITAVSRPRWRKHTLKKAEAGAAMMRAGKGLFDHLDFGDQELQRDANLVRILDQTRQSVEALGAAVTQALNEAKTRLFDRTSNLGDLVYGVLNLNIASADARQQMARISQDFLRIEQEFARGVQATRDGNEQLRAEGESAVAAAEADADALAVENQVLRGGSLRTAPAAPAPRRARSGAGDEADAPPPRPRRYRSRRTPRR